MTTGSPYSTEKLLHHPAALDLLRRREHIPAPLQVHFMPELSCPHRCAWCAYGHRMPEDGKEERGWKNMVLMDERARLPWPKAVELIEDWQAMGVRSVEVTGGGEPLAWPHFRDFLRLMAATPIEVALVTNGTLMDGERADLLAACCWKWARVSIDAGIPGTYVATRRISVSQWGKAWRAVELLAERRTKPDQRVGVGYVLDRGNMGAEELREFVRLAKDAGADNARFSLAFTPAHLDRFEREALDRALATVGELAGEHVGSGFEVVGLAAERAGNLAAPRQDYAFCAAKEVLCVVGGDANVYTCCTLAFNPRGLIGSIKHQRFRDLWGGDAARLFAVHDARKVCEVECLYERRNKRALELLAMSPEALAAARAAAPEPPHVNFI